MSAPIIAIKIDVDTDRGTRIGVPNLISLLEKFSIPATFLFSLGPDNTGRAIARIFRPGFLKKIRRTNVVGTYGLRTLLNGTLLPAPHIGRRNADIMRMVRNNGHEVGIHCYDHIRWQDGVHNMTQTQVFAEFNKAETEFKRIFNEPAQTAGAAGWQANACSLAAYDKAELIYGSDCRGSEPFFPRIHNTTFKTLQIPSTLPTLDELIGRPEFPEQKLIPYILSLLKTDRPNVFTTHAEIEGMAKLTWFSNFIEQAKMHGVTFVTLVDIAYQCLQEPEQIPVCEFVSGEVDGRSGMVAMQGEQCISCNLT